MSRRDMFTSVPVRELYDVYLKTSRHTYDIGIIVDLTPVSDRYNSRSYTGIRLTPCEYAVGSMRVRTRVSTGNLVQGKLCDIVIGVINLDLSSVGTTKLSTDRPADQIFLQT